MVCQIVEFYAPWCGHCQNLKPAYEKAARNLDGLANVAAIDCDEETNKQFCGSMGVQGFPTLKIVRPGKKFGKPVIEDYQGARSASGITEAVVSKINNHVARVADKDLDAFLDKEGAKAILFTEKGTTSALIRSVAIDYLGLIEVAQIRNKEKKAVEKFGVKKFPTLVLVPGDGKDAVTFDGELNKKAVVDFLRQAGEPHPAASTGKADKKKPAEKKEKKEKKKTEKKTEKKAEKKAEKKEEEEPVEEPTQEEAEPKEPAAPKTVDIQTVADFASLQEQCLHPKAGTCVLAIVPSESTEESTKVVDSLTQLNTKYAHGHRQVFPFIAVPHSIEEFAPVKEALGLAADKVELVALNLRRKWWRQYEGDFSAHSVEAWIDTIRMGEGSKKKLPKSIIPKKEEEEKPTEEAKVETEPEAETEEHDEL